jgi:hypothetical protein
LCEASFPSYAVGNRRKKESQELQFREDHRLP